MMALYAFARLVDDWGDGSEPSTKKARVDQWHDWIERRLVCYLNEEKALVSPARLPIQECDDIGPALADTIDRFSIPITRLHEIVDGVAFDLSVPVTIDDQPQLERYCYLVASSVGLACLNIWGGNLTKVQQSAIDCGIAFQITNIIRDVLEDSQRGRIYVPRDLLAAHDVDPARWLSGKPNGDWKSALRSLIESAHSRYRSGLKVQAELDVDASRMFSLMWHTYHRLLEELENDLDVVWQRRVSLSLSLKGRLFLQHAFTPWYRMGSR